MTTEAYLSERTEGTQGTALICKGFSVPCFPHGRENRGNILVRTFPLFPYPRNGKGTEKPFIFNVVPCVPSVPSLKKRAEVLCAEGRS